MNKFRIDDLVRVIKIGDSRFLRIGRITHIHIVHDRFKHPGCFEEYLEYSVSFTNMDDCTTEKGHYLESELE